MERASGNKMRRDDTFSTYHPVISFAYFVLVLGCAMFVMHPVFLGISMISGFLYLLYLRGRKALKSAFLLMLPVFLLSAVVNPLFNHQGVTILFYLKTGNPFTLESVIYGLAAGAMLVSVLNWFSCYQDVMTSDKFIYLFGKVIPAMSLIFSMVLRFVPKYKNQITKVSEAQRCIGRDVTDGNVLTRSRNGMKILSIMTTWALENSVETADSMKSRGYGLRGRTNYAIYRFDSRDRNLLGVILVLGAIVMWGILTDKVRFLYFPMILTHEKTFGSMVVFLCYGILCILPMMINLLEDIKWQYLRSKI